jgi:Immunity protein 26
MPRRKLPYKEGDWFCVPLESGGYGLGIVARTNGRGCILGYFFGPRRAEVPSEGDAMGLTCGEAVLVAVVGDLGILERKWSIVWSPGVWDREQWPVPAFGKVDEAEAKGWRIEYSDALQAVRSIRVSLDEARRLPADGVDGYVALEVRLTMALSDECPDMGTP